MIKITVQNKHGLIRITVQSMIRGHLLCIAGQARNAVELLTQSLKAVKVWMEQVGAEFQL